jgi:hypothetical protein
MYFSGAWRGYWEQAGFGRQLMHDLTLHFDGGRIDGSGYDCIGAFAFVGGYDELGGVYLVKQYVGRHKVEYHGRYDGEGTIFGRWTIGEDWSGSFALSPEKFTVSDAPILAITADPLASA